MTLEIPWTTEQKIFIVEAYFRQKSIHAAQLQFKERFRCREFPVHSMIYRWVNKFRTHGTVHNLNRKDTSRQSYSGRPKSSRTPHNVAAVRDSVAAAQASLCVGEVRSLESTASPCGEFWSQISTCILTGYRLNKSLHLMTWGSAWSCASGFATRLTLCQTFLTMSGFRTRHIFCCRVTWTLKTTSSGEAHPLSTVCKGHYTLWSALPGLPSPNMASLDHSGSRTTMSSVWQSTPSDMSRCLASSGQHLVDGERSSGSSSGSSRMVPPPTPQKNHWHGYSSVFLTEWSAAGVTRSGRRIHRTWTLQIFICGDTLRTGSMPTTPKVFLTSRQQSQQQ